MTAHKYSLSYTTGAALLLESVIVAGFYVEFEDWPAVRTRVIEGNSFQSRTMSSLKKLYGEISRRLRHLSTDEIRLLVKANDEEVKAIVWLAICRQYLFIKEFTTEVISSQYASSRFLLTHDDYDAFFNAKAEWHNNLDSASKSTKSKARQVLFKMLKECGLINEGNEILKQHLNSSLTQLIANENVHDLSVFPGVNYE